jgi:membrane protease YdiL (CAAX protease family)
VSRALSSLLGVPVLIGVTVILSATVGVFALGIGPSLNPHAPFAVSVSATADTNQIVFVHGGGQPVYFLYLLPVPILLVDPTDELIFREVVRGQFRRAYGTPVAVAAASAIFAAVHLSSYSGDGLLATLGTVLILGGVLGIVYEKSENLVVPAVVHGLFNTVQFAAVYATTTGLV